MKTGWSVSGSCDGGEGHGMSGRVAESAAKVLMTALMLAGYEDMIAMKRDMT